MPDDVNEILTIGHSTMSYERFLVRLRDAGVTAVADVRSAPYSRRHPHFNSDILQGELRRDGIAYVFLGETLGGRPSGERFFCGGIADYEKMAQTSAFTDGIERVVDGRNKHKIALMCSEHNPLDCHRCLLVGRVLKNRAVPVAHILANGERMSQDEIEAALLKMAGGTETDLFAGADERLAKAYRERSLKVAFSKPAKISQAAE